MKSVSNPKNETRAVEVCIARYNETTDWLSETQFCGYSKVIYNKGPAKLSVKTPKDCAIVELPNVGREGHTFLHHIVTNYDTLADITIFLPGSCMDSGKAYKTGELLKKVRDTQDTVISGAWYPDVRKKFLNFSIDSWKGTNDANETINNNAICKIAEVRPFGMWYRKYFGDLRIEVVSFTSIFAVSSVHIRRHSRLHYQNLVCCLDKHSNPEEGHYIERAWVAIFAPLPETCLIAPRPLTPPPKKIVAPSIRGMSFINALAAINDGQKKTASSSLSTAVAATVVARVSEGTVVSQGNGEGDKINIIGSFQYNREGDVFDNGKNESDDRRNRREGRRGDNEGYEEEREKKSVYSRYCDDGRDTGSNGGGDDYDRGRNKWSRFS